MITRAQKKEEIAKISDQFARAKAAFLVDFKGMNVEEVTTLRKSLKPLGSEMKVVRNTLAKLAIKDHPAVETALTDSFVGTNALVFAYEDASSPAKALAEFSKTVEELVIKAGVMGGQALDEQKIHYLATLPGKDELRAKLLGTLQAPMQKFVGVLDAVPSGFVRVLNSYKETKA